jgi:FkbM family methyltransferase
MESRYFSQHKQDQVIDKIIFGNKENKIFVDIGANDGITYSNTYFLEKNRSWTGLCIEPLPSTFEKLQVNRNCIMENCAVGSTNRKDILIEISGYSEMLSGLKKNYHKDHLSRIDNEISNYGGVKNEIEIDCVNVNDLLAKHSLFSIDYCNIDTEGSETEIINALDYNMFKIDVITIEANYKIERIRIKLKLIPNGFKYITNLGNDMLFVHKRLLRTLGDYKQIKEKILEIIK